MAEITRRRLGELVQGVLRILKDQPDGMRARDVDLWVEHYDRVAETHRRLLPLRPVWFLAPNRE